MKIGFTGTRSGMNEIQKKKFKDTISELKPEEFHHGCCIGSDEYAGNLVHNHFQFCKVVLHPPTITSAIGNCFGHKQMTPKPYLDRNKDIVDDSDILIAAPSSNFEEIRSGTWATVRYARKQKKQIIFLYPD